MRDRLYRFLRWSEKYTKTDMTYLARGGFFYVIGQVTSIAATLLLATAVSHFVPKESYGTYKYVLSIIAILSLFSLNSMESAVFQSVAQGFDGALLKAFWQNIRWSAAIFIGAFVLGIYYFVMGNATLAEGVLVGGMLSPFLTSANFYGSFLGGKKDFYRQTLYGVIDNIVPILLFVGVIMLTSNPAILIATYFLTNTLAALYFYRRTVRIYHANLHLHDTGMFTYSKHLSIMGIVNGIASNLDQILVFHFIGGAQLAIYNFAIAIPDQIKSPIKNLGAMLQPRFVQRTGREIQLGMKWKLIWMTIGGVFLTAAYILAAPYIFHLLFPKYMEAVWYSQIYALWILTISLDPVATYLVARKLTKELYANSIVYSIFQIISLLIGVLLWGILGIIIARVVTRVVIATLNYFLYRRAIAKEVALERMVR